MKILLINPPQTFFPGSDPPAANLPLGLMYIAAVLDKAGYETEILDAFMTDVPFRKNGDTTEVGMPYEMIKEEIQKRKPDIVGIANPFTTQIEHAIRVADIVKEVDQSILTVVGGPHVTVVPTEFLEETKNVDIVAIGEGEYTMLDIVKFFEGKKKIDDVQGVAQRINKKVKLNAPRPFNKNLDELPYPAYHLIDMEKYLNPTTIEYRSFQSNALSMITSRGCPFNCVFCAVHLHMGKTFRAHSVEYVVGHIEYLVNKYHVKTIYFEDDNLTFDIKRFEAICDKIIEKNIKFQWETPNGVRADYLTLELLKKMKKTGCQSVFVGIESGDQYVLDNIIHKDLKLKKVIKFAKRCKKIGLKTGAFYIIGFPGETKETMMNTVKFALMLKRKYDVGMHLLFATPSYGTRLHEECTNKGYVRGELTPRAFAEVRQTWGLPLIETENFTATDVKEIAMWAIKEYRKISIINYIKYPRKTLKSVMNQPNLVGKFIKNLQSK
ncbi:MAG: B12-binding domain-containing radical SAM protein [Candidatus Bathyarchaeota archaeon]|nr:B12-binding domain-containing radical SAM protein [Candidatus Bathyarchaeum sp.]